MKSLRLLMRTVGILAAVGVGVFVWPLHGVLAEDDPLDPLMISNLSSAQAIVLGLMLDASPNVAEAARTVLGNATAIAAVKFQKTASEQQDFERRAMVLKAAAQRLVDAAVRKEPVKMRQAFATILTACMQCHDRHRKEE